MPVKRKGVDEPESSVDETASQGSSTTHGRKRTKLQPTTPFHMRTRRLSKPSSEETSATISVESDSHRSSPADETPEHPPSSGEGPKGTQRLKLTIKSKNASTPTETRAAADQTDPVQPKLAVFTTQGALAMKPTETPDALETTNSGTMPSENVDSATIPQVAIVPKRKRGRPPKNSKAQVTTTTKGGETIGDLPGAPNNGIVKVKRRPGRPRGSKTRREEPKGESSKPERSRRSNTNGLEMIQDVVKKGGKKAEQRLLNENVNKIITKLIVQSENERNHDPEKFADKTDHDMIMQHIVARKTDAVDSIIKDEKVEGAYLDQNFKNEVESIKAMFVHRVREAQEKIITEIEHDILIIEQAQASEDDDSSATEDEQEDIIPPLQSVRPIGREEDCLSDFNYTEWENRNEYRTFTLNELIPPMEIDLVPQKESSSRSRFMVETRKLWETRDLRARNKMRDALDSVEAEYPDMNEWRDRSFNSHGHSDHEMDTALLNLEMLLDASEKIFSADNTSNSEGPHGLSILADASAKMEYVNEAVDSDTIVVSTFRRSPTPEQRAAQKSRAIPPKVQQSKKPRASPSSKGGQPSQLREIRPAPKRHGESLANDNMAPSRHQRLSATTATHGPQPGQSPNIAPPRLGRGSYQQLQLLGVGPKAVGTRASPQIKRYDPTKLTTVQASSRPQHPNQSSEIGSQTLFLNYQAQRALPGPPPSA